MRFIDLETCAELTAEHAIEAIASLASMRSFLDWAQETARPEEGAPKVLLAIGKLSQASWVDGTLYVDITGDDAVTKISVFSDYGFGIRERLLPLVRLGVPFDEFVRAVRLSPKLVAPFRGEHLAGSLVLTPPDASIHEGGGIAIDESSLLTESEASMVTNANKTSPPPDAATVPPPGSAITAPPPSTPEQSGIHTQPTVRRMVAVRPEALRSGNDD